MTVSGSADWLTSHANLFPSDRTSTSDATRGSSACTGTLSPACAASAEYSRTVASGLTFAVTAAMCSTGYVHSTALPAPVRCSSRAGRPAPSGLAILFITHDLSLGHYISDRTVILRRGAVVEMGPTPAVFANPQHSYTRMLLSAVPQIHHRWQAAQAAAKPNGRPDGSPLAARPGRFGRLPARRLSAAELDRIITPPVLTEREPGHLVAAEEAVAGAR